MCDYANCHEQEKLPITVTIKSHYDRRLHFCGALHAGAYLIALACKETSDVNQRMAAMAATEVLNCKAVSG